MKLPPTIEDIIYSPGHHWIMPWDLAWTVAAEACRLQREADFAHFDKGDKYPRLNDAPLIVKKPE